MNRVTAALFVALIAGGCTNYRHTKNVGAIAMGAGGLTTVVAGIMCLAYAFPGGSEADPDMDADLRLCGAVAIGGGLAFAVGFPVFLHGLEQESHVDLERAAERERRNAEARALRIDRAWSITNQAADSARAGDCAAVTTRDRQVRELDAEVHSSVFMRNIAIKRCVDAARPGTPPVQSP